MITDSPPVFNQPLPASEIIFNPGKLSSLTVGCSASGSPLPVITWRINNELMTSLNSPTGVRASSGLLQISNLASSNITTAQAASGWYTCVAANKLGSVTRDVQLVVYGTREENETTLCDLLTKKKLCHCIVKRKPESTHLGWNSPESAIVSPLFSWTAIFRWYTLEGHELPFRYPFNMVVEKVFDFNDK